MAPDASQMIDEPTDAAAASPALRTDAHRNRARIVDVARETFAEVGLDVTMREIARRADVGVATLYRRFPTKESLITETFAEQIAECVAALDAARADPDPWRGFCAVVEKVCAMQAVDRGLTAALLAAFPDSVEFEQARAQQRRGFAELAQRAKDSGQLRADFGPDDLRLLIMANGGIRTDQRDTTLAASRRLVTLLLQSLQAHPTDPPAPLPPTPTLQLHYPANPAPGAQGER